MITITPKLAGLVAASAVALMAPVALAAAPHKVVKTAHKSVKAAHKSTKASASLKAAAWSFPPCTNAVPEYEYIYSGDPCTSTTTAATAPTIVVAPVIEIGVASLNPLSQPSGAFCNGNAEYDYIYSGCQS